MALVYFDRVKDTFTTTGTGTLTVANSAPTGYLPTSTVGNANSSYFVAYDITQANWEVWLGTYTSSGTTLSRTTILASSAGGSAVTWAAGTKTLELVSPAALFTNTVRSDTTALLAVGYTVTPFSLGTITTGTTTLAAANGNQQYLVAGGAFSLAPQTAASQIIVEVLNNTSSGAITTSGYTKVTGDTYTPGANTNKYLFFSTKSQTYSHLNIVALQ